MLMLPTPNQSVMQNNLAATPIHTTIGTTVTANASANTKGSWAQIFASTNFDSTMMVVVISNNSLSANARNSLIDIGIGAAASEVVLVSNMMGTSTIDTRAGPGPVTYYCPIYIPKGTRIAARSQCSTGSQACSVVVFLSGGPSAPWHAFSAAEAIGIDTSTSKGTAITAGNSGTESAYTSVGAATSREYRAILPMIGTDTVTAMTSLAYHMEWGYSSTTLGERYFVSNNTEFVGNMFPCLPDYAVIPASTQLQVRAECSGTGEALQYGLLGFY